MEIVPEIVREAIEKVNDMILKDKLRGKRKKLGVTDLFYIETLIKYAEMGLRGEDLWE